MKSQTIDDHAHTQERTDVIDLWRQYLGGNGEAGQAFVRRIMPPRQQPRCDHEADQPDTNTISLPQVYIDVIEAYDAASQLQARPKVPVCS